MFKFLNILSFFWLLMSSNSVKCDYFASVDGLRDLIALEMIWIENLEAYAKKLEETNELIRSFLDQVENEINFFHADNGSNHEDPLGCFKLLRRFHSGWSKIDNLISDAKASDAYAQYLTQIQTELELEQPTEDDLIGAAKGLARLQSTYGLKTEDVASGRLLTLETSANMTAADCFFLGCGLFYALDNQHAIDWLLEAQKRLELPSNATNKRFLDISKIDILEYLTASFWEIGNFKMAAKLNEELLALDPENFAGLEDKQLYENSLNEQRIVGLASNFSYTIPDNKTELEHLYEAVCREELTQTPAKRRNLRCRYVSNNVPFCILAPFKLEELSLDPRIVYYHEAIYKNEIDQIIDTVEDNLERTQVGHYEFKHQSDLRVSKGSWLWYESHKFMDPIAQRLTDMTGLSMETAEALQVANYGVGGHFGPHHDCRDYSSSEMGNRIATAMFYISDVELGGGTAFPLLRLVVPPVARSLVLWFNMHESSEFDHRVIHAGCPVLKGSKWVCNEWLHEGGQEFRRPCSLQQQGHKSIQYRNLTDWHLYDRMRKSQQ